MKHLVLLVLAYLTLGLPGTAFSESYETSKAQLDQARDAYHAMLDQLPFNALRLDFASAGSAAFTAEAIEVTAMAPRQEQGYYFTLGSELDVTALYDAPQAMADTYVAALMAGYGRFPSPNRITVFPPFRYPFDHEIDAQAVSFGGAVIELPRLGSSGNGGLQVDLLPPGVEIGYPDKQTMARPSHVDGVVKLRVPRTMRRYQFADLMEGHTRSSPEFKVILRQHSGRFVAFDIMRTDGTAMSRGNLRVYISGVSADAKPARVLQSDLSNVTDPPAHWAAATDLLSQYLNKTITLQQAQDALRPLRHTSSDRIVFRAAFAGPVSRATIVLLETDGAALKEYRFSIPVTDYTGIGRDLGVLDVPIPMPVTVLDADQHQLLQRSLATLTADQISDTFDVDTWSQGATFRLRPVTSDLLFSYQNPRMRLTGPPTFINAVGDAIALPKAPLDRPNDDQPFSFFNGRLVLYPDRLSERPHRVMGEVEVAYLPEMLREVYSRNDLPPGVQIIDNMVITGGFLRRDTVRVLALDADGRPLKRFFDRRVGFGPFGMTVEYYYGRPSRVEVLQTGPIAHVTQAFDITLTEND